MLALARAVNRLSLWSGHVLSYLILATIAIQVYGVVARYVFNRPTSWGYEMSLFTFGTYFMLAGAYCLAVKSHVLIDIVSGSLPFRAQMLFSAVAYLIVLVIGVALVRFGGTAFLRSFATLETSGQTLFDPPIWWYRGVIPLAGVLLALQAASDFLKAVLAFIRGQEAEA